MGFRLLELLFLIANCQTPACWALNDKDKLAPLLKLGMKITKTEKGNKFRPDKEGKIPQFESCKLVVTKEEWLTNPAR